MTHLLLISLGPIQEFIASARRCQDLWFGSWLLSTLAREAAAAIERHPGGQGSLVFPGGLSRAALERGRNVDVANKILAEVTGGASVAREVAEAARSAMIQRLRVIAGDVFDGAKSRDHQHLVNFHEEHARAQIEELIEFLWVAVPVSSEAGSYGHARREAERLLAARKNSRSWAQPSWSLSGVPKSSLDGVRESVLDERIYPAPGRAPSLDDTARRRAYGVSGAERLCGVGLLKRLGRRDDDEGRRRFYSTSHLAALPWMIGLERGLSENADVSAAWTEYCNALDAIRPAILESADVAPRSETWLFQRVDGQVLFDGRIVETVEECGLDEAAQRKALAALGAFRKRIKRGEPQPYYAILFADGDRMGTVIDHDPSAARHRSLSKTLTAFAGRVNECVVKHHGSLVYSGGDDVLALLPLHTALRCASSLADDFAGAMAGWKNKDGQPPTLSAGLAVVHHLTPLDAALGVARRAEKLAKQTRNALAVIVDKRGGAETAVSGPWTELVPALRALTALHRMEAIPAKAGYELASLDRLTWDVVPANRSMLTTIARSEALRILARKREEGGDQALRSDVLNWLTERVVSREDDVAAIGRLLVVAQQFAGVEDEAGEALPSSVKEVLQ